MRGGYVAGANWDKDSIGYASFAFGNNTKAKGLYSAAWGEETKATGDIASTAFGYLTTASGRYSTAWGESTRALGFGSTASGYNTTASGLCSFAANYATTASGPNSAAFGNGNAAIGYASVAFGGGTGAKAAYSMSLGFYNDVTDNPDPLSLGDNDRIFQIGNGDFVTRRNVMTVLRNGYTGFGTVTPGTNLHVAIGSSGYSAGYFPGAIIEGAGNMYLDFLTPNSSESGILFGKASDAAHGGIVYNNFDNPNGLQFRTNGNSTKMVITSTGDVGIGDNFPDEKLEVVGNVKASSYKYSSPKTYYYSIPSTGFQPTNNTDPVDILVDNIHYSSTTTVGQLVAPVNLPHGAVVTAFTVYYHDASTPADLLIQLLRREHSNGSLMNIMASFESASTPGNTNGTDNTIFEPQINNLAYTYSIFVRSVQGTLVHAWPSTSLLLRSIVITYTLSEAQ